MSVAHLLPKLRLSGLPFKVRGSEMVSTFIALSHAIGPLFGFSYGPSINRVLSRLVTQRNAAAFCAA